LEPIQSKLSRLTAGYLDELIDEDTYREKKEEFILEKTALKREKERLRKTRSSAWIEPALEAVRRLESMGNETFPNTYSAIAEQVRKIGTNPVISGKTVSFIFSEPYASIPSILASARIATPPLSASRSEEDNAFTKVCAMQGSNLRPLPCQYGGLLS
jgi:ABC-type transport system substrate-binding protein